MCDHYYHDKINNLDEFIEHDSDFLVVCTESDEMDIFECESVMELIKFKWEKFSFYF